MGGEMEVGFTQAWHQECGRQAFLFFCGPFSEAFGAMLHALCLPAEVRVS
jgi:hypothetical protein